MSSTEPPPTPRLSSVWEMQINLAEAVSGQLRAREAMLSSPGPELDTRRASMLRGIRVAVDYWARRFARWPVDKTLTLEAKARDHREWSLLLTHVLAVLETA